MFSGLELSCVYAKGTFPIPTEIRYHHVGGRVLSIVTIGLPARILGICKLTVWKWELLERDVYFEVIFNDPIKFCNFFPTSTFVVMRHNSIKTTKLVMSSVIMSWDILHSFCWMIIPINLMSIISQISRIHS